ncbi:MAG: copper oxidase [Archangium sp.]|nr:copper oxidase [Archangium sp.]MDP3154827.1 copper oxidase [Archangium sp.]MDP3575037.1 copper oxidase [Archangium sp.]
MNRRELLQLGMVAGGALGAKDVFAKTVAAPSVVVAPGGQKGVITPNGSTLPLKLVGGVKVGQLVAHEFDHELAPGLKIKAWGYNGSTPGPTIEVTQGDRVRLYVTNRLPEATTMHWHGVILPNGMDGVSGLTQKPIEPGETFLYEFTFKDAGTFMYHPHFDEMTQMALGMNGMIVVHPKVPRGPRVDRDFALMAHEWLIHPGAARPDPNAMQDFNVLTFNSKAFPATAPLVMGVGERVRIRIGNLSPMDHHPIHLHGLSAELTWTDGGEVPQSARHPETTFLVPVGAVRVFEFVPREAGDWAMHCHMTHHVMNQMGHGFPVMIGADARRIDRRVQALVPSYMTMGHDGMGAMSQMEMKMPTNSIPMMGGKGPFASIDMGGMFTVLKVRARPDQEDGTGWYQHPKGTVAEPASQERLTADGIDPERQS